MNNNVIERGAVRINGISMSEVEAWNSMIEIHRQGVVVGTLLGGFPMSSAFSSFSDEWNSPIQKYTSIAALVAAVSFICIVCISSLILFIYSDVAYLKTIDFILPSRDFIITLAVANLFLGCIAMGCLFAMLALLGWEKGTILGVITTGFASIGVVVLLWSFWVVYLNYQIPVYGGGPVIPQP